MNSLERRLAIGLAASIVLLLALFWLLVNNSIRLLSEELVSSRLAHDAESILAALEIADGVPRLPEGRSEAIYRRAFSGHYFVILSEAERLHSRSLWDFDLPVRRMPVGESSVWRIEGPMGQALLVRAGGYRKQGAAVTVATAEDISPISASLSGFNMAFGLLTVTFLLGLLALQRLIVRRSFRPLDRMVEAIARLERGEIAALPESGPTEVRPLVREVNRLLDQMGRRVERSRNALGNLAHALKGQLNLLRRVAERERDGEIAAPVERIGQLIEHELRRARIAGTASPGKRFRPAEELPLMVQLLDRVYAEKALSIRWQAPPDLVLVYDREDMLELIGNLLDNACKWATSEVHCRIEAGDGIRITVEDDGSGCSEAERGRLAERGTRVDEAIPGHGLGLSIVKDIAESYGARLEFSDAEPGGLRVTVVFPGE